MIYRKIWSDPWFRKLTHQGKLLWIHLLTQSDTLTICGITQAEPDIMGFYCEIPVGEVEAMLGHFEAAGKICRENDCILIRNFIEHQNYNAKQLISCETNAAEWERRCPALAEMVLDLVNEVRQNRELTDKELKPAQAKFLPLTERLIGHIHNACVEGLGQEPTNTPIKCAPIIEKIVRLDLIPEEDIEPVLIWALQDSFWQNVILSIPMWRKVSERNSRPKFCNCWSSWRQAMSMPAPPQGPELSAEYIPIQDKPKLDKVGYRAATPTPDMDWELDEREREALALVKKRQTEQYIASMAAEVQDDVQR